MKTFADFDQILQPAGLKIKNFICSNKLPDKLKRLLQNKRQKKFKDHSFLLEKAQNGKKNRFTRFPHSHHQITKGITV